MINLGAKTGTKVKRPQGVQLSRVFQPVAFVLMSSLALSTPTDQFIMGGLQPAAYQRLLARACVALSLPMFTPHSARAGFATDLWMEGLDFVSIRELGRWRSDSSLRIYLDAVAVNATAASLSVQQWKDVLPDIATHFLDMFKWWPPVVWPTHTPLHSKLSACL